MIDRLIAACRQLASGEAESYPPRVMTPVDVVRQHWDYQVDVAVVGFGGGTDIQRRAGVEDSPENMYHYLQQEVRDAVSERTLREFCGQSPENFD